MSLWSEWDLLLFKLINTGSSNSVLDIIAPILRYPKTWIPLYLSMLILALFQYKKKVWIWVLFCILCITLTDQISSQWLKYLFDRPRPCSIPEITEVILRVNRCPGNASFPSSHAVNHTGIALFFLTTLSPSLKAYRYFIFLWPISISFAQVYVGVHYPSDVLGGIMIGCILGLLPSLFFHLSINNKKRKHL